MVWFADYAKLEKRLQPLNRILLCRNMESGVFSCDFNPRFQLQGCFMRPLNSGANAPDFLFSCV